MWVTMINSVGEYEAGKKYNLEREQAEHFVIAGYAEGELDREVTEEERKRVRDRNQEVSLG
jgi:hypothetical protein